MIHKFIMVDDGKHFVLSRLKLGTLVIFVVIVGGPVIKISVLLKFKRRKLEFSHIFNSLTHIDKDMVW